MPKVMTAKEFREAGYLQEVNRQFFHPLGMALVICKDDDGAEQFAEVLDFRADPQGIIFDPAELATHRELMTARAERIAQEVGAKSDSRIKLIGNVIQPLIPAALEKKKGNRGKKQ